MSLLDPLAAAATICTALAAVRLVAIEVLRSIVNVRRRRATGVGGTGDITFWGLVITGVFLAGAVVTGVAWVVRYLMAGPQ